MSNAEGFNRDNPNILWVAPVSGGKQRGTYDEPFGGMVAVSEHLKPGDTIVLKAGRYEGDVTFQTSGTADKPITITADHDADVTFSRSCWYLYDVSDLIIKGIAFSDSPQGAISIVGACERNILSRVRFLNCGSSGKGGCTVFFGGAGGRCNIVEDCLFEAPPEREHVGTESDSAHVGIVITEGDEECRNLNRDLILRGNIFSHYDCGVLVGTRGVRTEQFGHIIERNTIEDCAGDGIRVKCGDTTVRGNTIRRCAGAGISVTHGEGTTVLDNRVEGCRTGIRILGGGHSVLQNCLIACTSEAVYAHASELADEENAVNVFIEHNTCIVGGGFQGLSEAEQPLAVKADKGTTCIIRQNIFQGGADCWDLGDQATPAGGKVPADSRRIASHFVDNNLLWENSREAPGVFQKDPEFANVAEGDYSSSSGFGAQAWAAHGGDRRPETDLFVGDVDDTTDGESGPVDQLIHEVDRDSLLSRSFFFGEEEGEGSHEVDDC